MGNAILQGIDAVLFDLDGTLVDSLPDIIYAVRQMENELGLTPVSDLSIKHWIGNGASVLVRRVLSNSLHDDCDAALHAKALSVFMGHYQSIPEKQTQLYPHALTVLQHLKSQGMLLGLVTNKPIEVTRPLLAHLTIQDLFSVVLGGGDVPEPKPSPMMIERALSMIEVQASRAIVVGDSQNDVFAAQAAGVRVVGVEGGYNHGEDIAHCGPDWVISDLRGLI